MRSKPMSMVPTPISRSAFKYTAVSVAPRENSRRSPSRAFLALASHTA